VSLALGAASAGCAGPPMTSAIEGEPVCADYEVGVTRTKMQGSLRFPVMLTIKDGDTPVMKTMVLGRRSEADPHTRVVLSDSNEEYTVEWAQCENERASKPAVGGSDSKDASRYECGNAAVYSSEKLVTKKGDAASHALKFAAPARPECWMSDAPAASPVDAGAPEAGPTEDAGGQAAGDDAGAPSDDAGADAGADAAAPVEAAADAGTDAGADAGDKAKKDAADEKKKKAEAK
jgi:hypothetical protein